MTSESTFDTLRLHGYLDRFQTGDQDAADALLRATCGRLENLARKMLKGFPNVKRWADTDDVLQNASIHANQWRTIQNRVHGRKPHDVSFSPREHATSQSGLAFRERPVDFGPNSAGRIVAFQFSRHPTECQGLTHANCQRCQSLGVEGTAFGQEF